MPIGVFCTRDKGTCIYGTGSWEEYYSIGVISQAPAVQKNNKVSLGIILAYMPRALTKCRQRATSKWKVLRLRVERFQIFHKIKSARSAPQFAGYRHARNLRGSVNQKRKFKGRYQGKERCLWDWQVETSVSPADHVVWLRTYTSTQLRLV